MAFGGNDATFRFGTAGAGEVKAELASLRAELDKLGQAKQRSAEQGTKAGREYTQVERDRVELAQHDLKITNATTKALRDQLVAEREIVKIRQQLKSGQLLPEEAHAAQVGVETRLRDKQAADAAQRARATQTALRSSTMQLAGAFTVGAGAALAFWGAVGDGAARAGRYAITQAAALEQQVDKAAAVMQGGQLVRQQLEDAAIAAGSKSAFSAVQAGEALEFLAMAGFNVVNATAALPGVLSLAAAGSIDLGRAADIASNILTGYGFRATELSAVNDVLVGTFTRSNVSLEQLGEAFKYVGPIAKASGQEFELMAASIGKLGDAGIQGSQAGTTLRQGLIRLQDPPKKARIALAELGIQTKDTAGNLLQLDQILAQISSSGANVGQIARIFGVESSAGFAALIQQGPDSLRRMADDLKRVQGLAAQIERAKLDNLNGQLQIAQGATETLAASQGKSLLPELTEVVKVSTDYLQSGVALEGVQRELARTADEQSGSLSTLARDGLAVADAAATRLVQTLSATLYVLTALGSPLDTLGKKTGWWAVQAESAGDSARGLVDGLANVVQIASVGTSHMPVFGQALGAVSVVLRTLSGDAAQAAEAIQAATDKRRAEEMAAGWAILKDVGVTTWRVLEGAALSYLQTSRAAITAEDLKRAEEAAAAADKIALARADLRVAQAGSAEERARAEAARDRLKISQELDDGKLLEVEASLKLAKINTELGKKLDDIHASEAKAATDRASRVELAQLELGLVGQTDERVRAQLDAERQMVAVRQQLAAGKLLSEEAAAKEAAITAALSKSLDEIDKKSATQTAQRALRVELARMDLAISGETDKALRARMSAERELAELRSRVAAGDTLPEEEAARRLEIERKLQGDLDGLRREADDARLARLDQQLGVAEQAASGLRGALSGLAEDDPWTRAVAGLGEIGAAALQTTLMLQAMESAEVGAGKAFVGAMQVAGPAVAAALGKMGVEQRALSGIKALFYGAEAVGQASIGNFVGAAQAGIAAGLHAAVAAGAGGGGSAGGGGAAGGLGGGGGAAAQPTFTPRGGEDASQRQLARYIGQELDKSGAQGGVTIVYDFSGSMAIDSDQGRRLIAEAAERGARQLGRRRD